MRIRRLDGLRAVAVTAVALYHHLLLRCGWIGVELFFVLSGFMIATNLRRDRAQAMYWKRFYLRRAARILPPALLLILLVGLYYHPPVWALLVYVLFLGNFANLTPWGIVPQLGLLWSLAVEEHFYLLFPSAVRHLHRQRLIMLLTLVIVVEPVARWIGTSFVSSFTPIYSWTIFRMDGLAMGAMLALLSEGENGVAWLTRWSGGGALIFAGVFTALSLTLPGRFERLANMRLFNSLGYSLIAIASSFVVAYILLHPETVFSRVLQFGPLVFLGTISYGLYLCHISVMLVAIRATGLSQQHVFPLSFAAAILCSWLSFFGFEKPIMAWAHRVTAGENPVSISAGLNSSSSVPVGYIA